MTQHDSSERKQRALREICDLADQHNLTFAEYVVLHLVYYEDRPIDLVSKYAAALWRALGFPVGPREDYDRALHSLLDKEHIQLIDDAARDSIREMLESDPALGPADGLPRIGTIHFTLDGLAFWQQIRRVRRAQMDREYIFDGVSAAPVYDGTRCTIYSMYICHAIKFAQDLNSFCISVPVPVGPWRCRWWDKYPSGFRIECEFPKHDDSTQ